MTDNTASRVIGERYLLHDRLGAGGMGTVWRATDQLLRRIVAVKEMHLQATGKEFDTQAARVRREAYTIARISHPNVVNIYDLVNEDERLWLVMEFVDGPSLRKQVDTDGPMGHSAVAGIGLQLLSALDYAHAAGVLHRDIKPGNVLLRPDGRAVLCDFGIAALAGAESLTETGGVVGSIGYVAPERLTDQSEGPASDLFSLGVTLCVLLYGRSPFARKEAASTLNAVLREEPNFPPDAGPLRPLLEALLRKNPAERPSSAEAGAELRSLAAPGADAPHGSTLKFNVVRRRRGRRIGLAVLSGAALVAVVAAAGFLAMEKVGETANGPAAAGSPSESPADQERFDATGPTRIDAVLPVPGDWNGGAPTEYWMFSGRHYIRGTVASSDRPVADRLTAPSPIRSWGTLYDHPEFRKGIDAVMPVPGSQSAYWVFSGDQYTAIQIDNSENSFEDSPIEPPRPIGDWEVFDDFHADGIDAVMKTPGDTNQYWVFSGRQYVRIRVEEADSDDDADGYVGATVESGPAALAVWTTLPEFDSLDQGIDAVMPVPETQSDYWVFAGDKYMRITVDENYEDTTDDEPKSLRNWTDLN